MVRSWYLLLLRGVLCNFLVCIGVFAGFRLQSETAKALVITLAITTFVLTGLEHSIANMAYFALHNPEAGPAGGQTREGEGNAKGMRKGISYWNRWPGCWFPSFSYLACMWCSTVICPPEAGSQEGRLWGLV